MADQYLSVRYNLRYRPRLRRRPGFDFGLNLSDLSPEPRRASFRYACPGLICSSPGSSD